MTSHYPYPGNMTERDLDDGPPHTGDVFDTVTWPCDWYETKVIDTPDGPRFEQTDCLADDVYLTDIGYLCHDHYQVKEAAR